MSTDLTDRDKLVEALLECDCMKTIQSRNRIVRDLPAEIQQKIAGGGTAKQDVDEIVDVSSQFPAGLEKLLQRVKCPAGLQLGAVTPPEIGFSIMGEILQFQRIHIDQAADAARAATPAADVMPDVEMVDPVCGMTVQVAGSRYTSTYDGKTFIFCGVGCKARFDHEPARYAEG